MFGAAKVPGLFRCCKSTLNTRTELETWNSVREHLLVKLFHLLGCCRSTHFVQSFSGKGLHVLEPGLSGQEHATFELTTQESGFKGSGVTLNF